jgi:hypothetical protein
MNHLRKVGDGADSPAPGSRRTAPRVARGLGGCL